MVMSPAGLGTENHCAGEASSNLPDSLISAVKWS
jgi:hypothetical protein